MDKSKKLIAKRMRQAKRLAKQKLKSQKSKAYNYVDPNSINIDDIISPELVAKQLLCCDDKALQLMSQMTKSNVEFATYVENNGMPFRCKDNAELYAKQINGKIVKGWQALVYSKQHANTDTRVQGMLRHGVVEWQQHIIVEGPDGKLYDTTPKDHHDVDVFITVFWRDDTVLTKKCYTWRDVDGAIGFGSNIIYIPDNSIYQQRNDAYDVAHCARGTLSDITDKFRVPTNVHDLLRYMNKKGMDVQMIELPF